MPEFNPFGQLMEVQRYKQNLAMKQDQIARQNAIQTQQLNQQAQARNNAMYQGNQAREAAQRRQMGLEMTLGNVPPERRQEELISRGYLEEAGQVRKALGKPTNEASPYNTPIKTSAGWVSYDNRTGQYKPITMEDGGRALPIQADVDLAGRKKGSEAAASAEAGRVAKLKANKNKSYTALQSFTRSADTQNKNIDEAIEMVSPKTAGFFGGKLADVSGSDAFTLREKLKTIMSAEAFGYLQEMRNNSPTGGAVGQLSDSEREVMGLIKASLNQGLDPLELTKNLKRIKKLTTEISEQAAKAYKIDYEPKTKKQPQGNRGSQALKSKYGLE